MGVSFVAAAYLQVVRGHDAIETGIIFTAETVGLLLSSLAAGRLAQRFSQKDAHPGRLRADHRRHAAADRDGVRQLERLGVRPRTVPYRRRSRCHAHSVRQRGAVELRGDQQGEISGLSRSVSNLGSSLGTAIAGTVLVAGIASTPGRSYALAMVVLAAFGVVGLIAAMMLPSTITPAKKSDPAPTVVPPHSRDRRRH